MPEKDDEVLTELEKHYGNTKIIYVIQKGDEPPKVQADPGLTENDVIANLVKALLFMSMDEYILEILDHLDPDDEDDDL